MQAYPRLRLASVTDVDFIVRLIEITMRAHVERTWGAFSCEATRQRVLDAVASETYSIVQWDDQEIGALAVIREHTHIQLDQIFILPAYQNRGFGTYFICELAREAAVAEKPLRLRVLAVNPARALYAREGFTVTATSPERIFMELRA